MPKLDKDYFNVDNEPIKKNEIEDILGLGEEVLLRLKPEKGIYIIEAFLVGLPIALLWAAFDAFAIWMMVSHGVFNEIKFMIPIIIIFFALHLIPVWIYIANMIKRVAGYKNITYAFTDRRIIIRSGIIGIDFKYIYYTDIDSVNVKVGLLDRMFKVGDLYIKSNTQTAKLDDIKNPYIHASKIQEIIRDLKADMHFPNDLRPEENHGYNTKYKK